MTLEGVVVGYDGSAAAQVALDWAADAAVAYGLPLTLLSARPDAEAELLDLEEAIDEGLLRAEAIEHLAAAREQVVADHPGLTVDVLISPDSPVVSLLSASEVADLVVMGSRGLDGFHGLVLGSTTMNVTPYADCPVVVLYEPDQETEEARAFARHPEQVVVGFDGSVFAERALTLALRHADVTGLGIAVVMVSRGRPERAPAPITLETEGLRTGVRKVLAQAMDVVGDRPDVTYLYGVGPPAGILIAEAAGAPLAVVGARGRGGFAQLLLGSVGLQMLLHAECPVAVVHGPRTPA